MFKLHLESKTKELEVKKAQLLEDCVRERNEKEKCTKMFEEIKKTIYDKRNVEIDELRKISHELLLANKKEEEELEKMEKKIVELREVCVIKAECEMMESEKVHNRL
ncbi:hypothetical protein V5N11_020056 [Cardamine amara subsp. amara]|uniref:Uncharacterized protein n=1 Tax=Cardamine amara subsp. amara TaxID=228776 RepID=A0ABD0ZLM0_CARAN